MRASAAPSGSAATAMWWALACSSVASSRMIPTWPFQNTRSPRRRRGVAPQASRRAAPPACPSRAAPPARTPCSATCTSPEQSMPQRGAPAPEIGRPDEALGQRHPVADRREVRARNEAAAAQPREAAGRAAHRHRGEAGQLAERSAPAHAAARRPGSTAPSPDTRPIRRPEPVGANVADVAVGRRLSPGEAVRPLLVDGEGLAEHAAASPARRPASAATPSGRAAARRPAAPARRVARRLHLPAQMLGREVGPRREQPGGERRAHR